jgi:hypothetical protein
MSRSGSEGAAGFVDFYRRYARTWVHAVATAALTAFGTLTFVHRAFAAVAVVAYVLPPLVFYFRGTPPSSLTATAPRGETATSGSARSPGRTDGETDTGRTARRRVTPDDGAEGIDGDRPGTADDGAEGIGGRAADHGPADTDPPRWTAVETPTDETLHDAVAGPRSYAVGSGGVVLAERGDDWTVAVSDGPGARGSTLHSVDAADAGGVWFAGESGALGRLDPSTGRHVDHSAPDDDTTDVVAVAAASDGSGETVLLTDGSGRVRRGRWRDGAVTWADPVTPGSGSSTTGAVLVDGSVGYVCDSNDRVFRTTDGGATFDRLDAVGASGTLTDVAATDAEGCSVTADDGVLYRFDGATWTPTRLGDDALSALSLAAPDGRDDPTPGDGTDGVDSRVDGVVCGSDATVYVRGATAPDWERTPTPATDPLQGVSVDRSGGVALAVGDGGGLIARRTAGSE